MKIVSFACALALAGCAPPDRAQDTPAELLVHGAAQLIDVTSDGNVAYRDTSGKYMLLDAASGRANYVMDALPGDLLYASGKAVALWTDVHFDRGVVIGALHVYTAEGVRDGDARSITSSFVTSADGSRLAYLGAMTATNPPTFTMTLANADLSAPITVATNVGLGTVERPCVPRYRFRGDRFFAATCDGLDTYASLRTVDEAGNVALVASDIAPSWTSDDRGERVLVVTSTREAQLHALPENRIATIDTSVDDARLSSDGRTVVYTSMMALKRWSVERPFPTTLVGQGVRGLLAVSPDFAWAMTYANTDGARAPLFDIQLANLRTPGPTRLLVPTPTGHAVAFTRGFALYEPDRVDYHPGAMVRAAPLAGGLPEDVCAECRLLVIWTASDQVAFTAAGDDDTAGIFVRDLTTSRTRQIGVIDAWAYAATDGRKAYYASDGAIYAKPLD
jgi:hypothetical protein